MRNTDRQTDREGETTYKQRERKEQTDRQRARETDRQSGGEREREGETEKNRDKKKQRYREFRLASFCLISDTRLTR